MRIRKTFNKNQIVLNINTNPFISSEALFDNDLLFLYFFANFSSVVKQIHRILADIGSKAKDYQFKVNILFNPSAKSFFPPLAGCLMAA